MDSRPEQYLVRCRTLCVRHSNDVRATVITISASSSPRRFIATAEMTCGSKAISARCYGKGKTGEVVWGLLESAHFKCNDWIILCSKLLRSCSINSKRDKQKYVMY